MRTEENWARFLQTGAPGDYLIYVKERACEDPEADPG